MSTYPYFTTVFGDSIIAFAHCGVTCGLSISKDRGNTWYGGIATGPYTIIDAKFINKDTVMVITDGTKISGTFALSTDGGIQWKQHLFNGGTTVAPLDYPVRICVKTYKEIYLVGRTRIDGTNYTGSAVILKSSDLGKTWVRHFLPFKKNVNDMKFINDSIALICGGDGHLFKWNSKTAIFTDINENSAGVGIRIFPNPVHYRLFIQKDESIVLRKTLLTTILGEILFESSTATKEIDVSHYPQGVYFVHIETEKGKRTFKVVKE